MLGYEHTVERSIRLYQLQAIDLGLFQLWGRSLLAAAGVLFFLVALNLPSRLRIVFIGGYGLLLLLPLLFSATQDNAAFMMTGIAGRLFVAPNILLGWMLLMAARFSRVPGWLTQPHRLISVLAGALLCVGLLWGFWAYWQTWVPDAAWVSWPQEVQSWQVDHDYLLRIQPEGWVVRLTEP